LHVNFQRLGALFSFSFKRTRLCGFSEVAIDASIGSRLKQWRTAVNLTQEEVAERSGIPLSTYKKYEGDNRVPGGEALADLANIGPNPHWILTGRGDMCVPEGASDVWSSTASEAVYRRLGNSVESVRQEAGNYEVANRLRDSTESVVRIANEMDFEPAEKVLLLVRDLAYKYTLEESDIRALLVEFDALRGGGAKG
jgi:transcriptional regulator with XRE-family HTH domain